MTRESARVRVMVRVRIEYKARVGRTEMCSCEKEQGDKRERRSKSVWKQDVRKRMKNIP